MGARVVKMFRRDTAMAAGRLRAAYSLLAYQLGLDPIRLWKGLSALPGYFSSYAGFRRNYKGEIELRPQLHDKSASAGTYGEYFWQDLYVARMVAADNPARHVDVGSRIDGFIGHLASFREVEVVDIRPIENSIPGVRFVQGDVTSSTLGIAPGPSVSCLHTVEHFGLGRYGDPIDPSGMRKGLRNLAALVAPEGTLYVSTPIGRERVIFNAHRISNPESILRPLVDEGLQLGRFLWFADGEMHESSDIPSDLVRVAEHPYVLGIFVLKRPV